MQTLRWLKENWLQTAILALPLIIVAAFWDRFPARVVVQWNASGPSKWADKFPGMLVVPALNVGLALLLGWIPQLDPRLGREDESGGRSGEAIGAIRLAVTGLLASGSLLIAASALGLQFDSLRIGINLLLLFFLVLGNYIGTIRPNHFVGVRTPWTLGSEEVWRLTHRLVGRIWVFGALAFFVLQFAFRESLVMAGFVAFAIGTGILGVPYSYWKFRSLGHR